MNIEDFDTQILRGKRFEFGKNWGRFLQHLDESKIRESQRSLLALLGVESLAGKSFLDAGCGSGLSSLAALQSGATSVLSFDFDPQSVACTDILRARYDDIGETWRVLRGSVLDKSFLQGLGTWDIVYSWGVLHHTGAMWDALELITIPVAKNGQLAISIYNDQGLNSQIWRMVKMIYNQLPKDLRFLVLYPAFLRLWMPTIIKDLFAGDVFKTWRNYPHARGMSAWDDVVDWVGGYPFEVSQPQAIIDFFHTRGFTLRNQVLRSGLGVNEFVFQKCG